MFRRKLLTDVLIDWVRVRVRVQLSLMTNKFSLNEIVMAADKGKLYEARILKLFPLGDGWQYFIHYNKWHRRYDTWIDESLVCSKSDTKRMESIREATKMAASGKIVVVSRGRVPKKTKEIQKEA